MPLYVGKGDKCRCSNSRGIRLLSVVDKLYGRVLIKRAGLALIVQLGKSNEFRQGRGCMDQVIAVSQVCEKYLMGNMQRLDNWEKMQKDSARHVAVPRVFWAFIDLVTAYDSINRHGMWRIL